MSDLSAADLAARVVAWHNRHPLARRLRAADVHSVGHVALPYHDPAAPAVEPLAAGAGSLRERAMARAREAPPPVAAPAATGPLRAAFRDDFIPPLSVAEVAAFGARHGIEREHEATGAPVRRVAAVAGATGVAWRWLLTAELRGGGARTRVLLSPVPGAAVLGRRLWSLPRVGALAALGGAAVAVTLGLLGRIAWPGSVPVAASAGAPGPVAAVLPAAAVAPASAASSAPDAAAVAPAASRPLDVEPQLGRVELPPIGWVADARRREAAASAVAATPGPAPSAATGAWAAAAVVEPPATPPSLPASTPVFALATRLLRTRAESDQIAEALTALLVTPGSPVKRVDVIRAGDDYRVVAWPLPGRDEAERAQSALLARGHRLQVISF